MIKALFFDMDGVLYDSMPNHEYTWIESFKSAGIDFPLTEVYMNEGRTGASTIRYAFEQFLGRAASEEEQQQVYTTKTQLMSQRPQAPVLPGMQKLLLQLRRKGIAVYVVTGSRQALLINELQQNFGVSKDHIITGRDVVHGKPHPEPYLIAWQRAKVKKEECMVIENAPLGIQSARSAGIFTIAVNTGKLKSQVLWDAGANELYEDTLSLCQGILDKTDDQKV